jgi:hypothetical protein
MAWLPPASTTVEPARSDMVRCGTWPLYAVTGYPERGPSAQPHSNAESPIDSFQPSHDTKVAFARGVMACHWFTSLYG